MNIMCLLGRHHKVYASRCHCEDNNLFHSPRPWFCTNCGKNYKGIPFPPSFKPVEQLDKAEAERRVVCAAIEIEQRIIITGARHYDSIMNSMIDQLFSEEEFNQLMNDGLVLDGFIDNKGKFLCRGEAWIIAERQGQIILDTGSNGTLFSENLY